MSAFTGTGTLIRLAFRRDRIKLTVWVLAIAGLMAADLPAVLELYANSPAKQLEYAVTNALSVVARAINGPINGPELGAIAMNEIFLFAALAVAFMSTLAIVRHTRQNEETGRAELLGSAVIGRHASLVAALTVVVSANVAVAGLLALVFIANDLPVVGSIGAAAAIGAVGIVFAGIAAVTSQVFENARSASSVAGITIGAAFLLRAVGDGMGKVASSGQAITSAWPSWLSPIGWGQQIHPYTQSNWWAFGLFIALFVGLVATAFLLNSRRDVGLGMIPARPGSAVAAPGLLSPVGLAWRLQQGVLWGWAIGMAIMGVIIGLLGKEFYDIYSSDQFGELLRRFADSNNITHIFFGFMFSLMAIVIAGYVLQTLLRMRAEESDGHLESVLAAGVSRWRWMTSHIAVALLGIAMLSLSLGVSTGLTYVLTTNAAWSETWPLITAVFAQAPAILAIAGLVIALFGLLPRGAVAVSWASFMGCLVIWLFGVVLELPQWVLNLSPFTHTPNAPAEAIVAGPLLALLAVSVGLTVAGLALFRRRDLTTG